MIRPAALVCTLLAIGGFGAVLVRSPAPPTGENHGSASTPGRRDHRLTAYRIDTLLSCKDPAGIATLSVVCVGDDCLNDDQLLAVREFPNVRAMILGSDRVTDAGIRQLTRLRRLEGVLLFCPKMSDDGLRGLATIPSMRAIGLYGASVTPAGLAEVRERHPQLLIDVYGEEGPPSQTDRMFDANGCPSTFFRNTYWRLRHSTVQAAR